MWWSAAQVPPREQSSHLSSSPCMYTSDFTYSTDSCHLQKFSDDTAIVGCVSEGNDLVCWGGGCSERDKKRLNRLIKRASSVCGCPLDSIEVMGERRALAKLSTIMDNTSTPSPLSIRLTVGALSSSFSNRLRHPRCRKELLPQELTSNPAETRLILKMVFPTPPSASPRRETVKPKVGGKDDDEDEAVTYSTVKASSSSAGASADLYATINKANK
ncbi:hypothetical protein L3Q82_001454 [Scortum barcoo]|uniref:Uncharacterized protein n=1 Tax=Scortum barcoo TaxID=214431 RepID=A0ACB8W7Y9_9TELE|nr:hypothetical protein L3Q82_001454 [Scortum barcoo]